MPAWIERIFWSIAKLALLSPVYFVVGCFEVVRTLRGGARHVLRLPAALKHTITCPHGHPNDATGRFECLECKAVYLGWVGRCPVCGAGASYIACDTCGVAIPLPWEDAR